ncbi:hypothetical protein IE4771_PB00241 (plasmid) [Rhizobium etli bv. mimosae str. IE4771]|uniref:Uncharacterized protein n=1 Tax=Rhizobium etli bv. mimosae str. IE4771 TaxID=1432050 RepID=A0A060IE50_RHIET|nr:hypothetical protein IE4771_PB00241 [Rhizobium sp. IE4771]
MGFANGVTLDSSEVDVESLRRTMMRSRNSLEPASGRQLDLIFKALTIDGLSDKERKKAYQHWLVC